MRMQVSLVVDMVDDERTHELAEHLARIAETFPSVTCAEVLFVDDTDEDG